jgi:hypothetical protein
MGQEKEQSKLCDAWNPNIKKTFFTGIWYFIPLFPKGSFFLFRFILLYNFFGEKKKSWSFRNQLNKGCNKITIDKSISGAFFSLDKNNISTTHFINIMIPQLLS